MVPIMMTNDEFLFSSVLIFILIVLKNFFFFVEKLTEVFFNEMSV